MIRFSSGWTEEKKADTMCRPKVEDFWNTWFDYFSVHAVGSCHDEHLADYARIRIDETLDRGIVSNLLQ